MARRWDVRVWVGALALLVAACGGPAPTALTSGQVIQITNRDGPDLMVVVNGKPLRSLPCNGGTDLSTQDADVPPLPWHLSFVTATGSTFGALDETADRWLGYVVVRRSGIQKSTSPIGGPAPVPSACVSAT